MADPVDSGLNKEDAYFVRLEFERVQKLTAENEAKLRQQEKEELRDLHWMRCPKDGMELVEIEFMGVHIDKCTHCGGIFLDGGELERLFEASKRSDGMLTRIFEVFR